MFKETMSLHAVIVLHAMTQLFLFGVVALYTLVALESIGFKRRDRS
jgi:hypothetical protein